MYKGQGADLSGFAGKSKRDSLPPVGRFNKVDLDALKLRLAQGSIEMDECINEGSIPIFGYPLVCYSPMAGQSRSKGELWSILY